MSIRFNLNIFGTQNEISFILKYTSLPSDNGIEVEDRKETTSLNRFVVWDLVRVVDGKDKEPPYQTTHDGPTDSRHRESEQW